MKLTPMQEAAVHYVSRNPQATADQIVDAVGVQGGPDNRAMFLYRLVNKGALALTITWDAADATGADR
jgi:hypothetical protein